MKRIGILRGGEWEGHGGSVSRGGELISHILENLNHKYKVIDIYIDRDGVWHAAGLPVEVPDLSHKVDVVWNLSHPKLSNTLESFYIKNIGTPAFSGALHKSRDMLREHMKRLGVNMPRHHVISLYQPDIDGPRDRYIIKKAKEVFEKFSSPWLVEAMGGQRNMGVHVADTFPELVSAIEDGVNKNTSMLVQELIPGKRASVHTAAGFRGEDIYATTHDDLSVEEKEILYDLAKKLHTHFGVKHYLKCSFVLHPKRGIFCTGFDFSPDLNDGSHFHESFKSIGAKAHHVIEHIIDRALI